MSNIELSDHPSRPARFVLVGSGWRSNVFLRLAQLVPDHLRATAVVTRSAERAAEVEARWGVETSTSLEQAVAADRPDFVIVSVPWGVTPKVTRACVDLGLAVLCETPPAPDVSGMRQLWDDVGATGLVQAAEQYPFYPGHAARRSVVEAGVIGDLVEVQVSSTHQYHAIALMRHLLGVGSDEARVSARRTSAPLVDPVTRIDDPTARALRDLGWADEVVSRDTDHTLAFLDLGAGRTGLYDFTDNQWHNPLRSNRIVLRGTRGEIVDDDVVYLGGPGTVLTSRLERRQTGIDMNFEGFDLDHISMDGQVRYRNPWQGVRLADDEIAVASLLAQMGAWVRDEAPAPYPLAEACQDHLLALAVETSIAEQRTVRTEPPPWSHATSNATQAATREGHR